MDTQVNAGSLVRTIADSEIAAVVAELVNALEEQATLLIKGFAETPPTPSRAHHLENRLGETLAGGMEPLRAGAQVQKLKELIDKARESKQKPVLSVSRDGVSLGMAPWSFFEMASVACVSVLADGKKLGTVYLGRVPESNQLTAHRKLRSRPSSTTPFEYSGRAPDRSKGTGSESHTALMGAVT